MLKLIFLSRAERRPELMQAVMLRRQNLVKEFATFVGELQMQAAAVIVAFTTFNPAAFFQFIGDAGGVGSR